MAVDERELYRELLEELKDHEKAITDDDFTFGSGDAMFVIAPILRKHFYENG